ncbi:class I SAM-dependent methyltransferase [Roseovarius sp. CAU 1744]|uniref:class I SAM-dependent methyltransferase n=1 Tax=Roseovarius sp. CAU 1744 TaxID=3140368 RepID=UPI00325B02AE
MNDAILEGLASFDFPLKEIWISAARFHFQNLEPEISQLSAGSRVLEIGCGAGLLLTMLRQTNPKIFMEGIEPLAGGFEATADMLRYFQSLGTLIGHQPYESFEPSERYDLVYLVNVMEHLPDWRHFLNTVPRFLKPDGRCLVLCPNYDFPFEPHFNRPVIGSKSTMARLFRRRIAWVEDTYGVHGLWDSLNFVRLSEIKRQLADTPLSLKVRHDVSDRMIARFDTDDVYRNHLAFIGAFGKILKGLRVTKLLRLKRLENLQPYIFLEFRYRPASENLAAKEALP